ncbi:hypothetical protein LSTR_LSTR005920 [Laodelphax striatellus]|uniref:Uncharacterized protein n=1 Tax=Laodelphax striatellus TaxID=195883 RepID=A0A482WGV0_LAOST|nr:hypothetical protein LSTR_LSTR005920 [Laodelphax striatellus]
MGVCCFGRSQSVPSQIAATQMNCTSGGQPRIAIMGLLSRKECVSKVEIVRSVVCSSASVGNRSQSVPSQLVATQMNCTSGGHPRIAIMGLLSRKEKQRRS